MTPRNPVLLALVALAAGALGAAHVACSAPESDGEGGTSALSQTEAFDKNNVVSNDALLDGTHITQAQLQRFLEKTPWSKRSALADYTTDSGKSASVVMQEAAETYGINVLELLVRAQMEQRLVSRTADELKSDGDEDKLDIAFGCGCPHAPVCKTSPEKYTGFEKQVACAAKLIADDMGTLKGGTSLRNGWRVGKMITTEDGVDITPSNYATATLYSYTPYAGGKGGGNNAQVGGMYLHWQIWQSFAGTMNYKAPGTPASNDDAGTTTTREAGTGTSTARDSGGGSTTTVDAGASCTPEDPDYPDCLGVDAGPTKPPAKDGGAAAGDGGDPTASGNSGDDDPGAAHEPDPQPSPPPAKGKSSKKTSAEPTELPDGGDDSGSSKKSGCSASPVAPSGDAGALAGLGLAVAAVVARRRRK